MYLYLQPTKNSTKTSCHGWLRCFTCLIHEINLNQSSTVRCQCNFEVQNNFINLKIDKILVNFMDHKGEKELYLNHPCVRGYGGHSERRAHSDEHGTTKIRHLRLPNLRFLTRKVGFFFSRMKRVKKICKSKR